MVSILAIIGMLPIRISVIFTFGVMKKKSRQTRTVLKGGTRKNTRICEMSMRTTVSPKDGGARLPQTFVMVLIAALVPTVKPDGEGGEMISCNTCDFSEDNYRGPTWSYPCMSGYQGPKKEDIKCTVPPNADGCFRRVSVVGGKKVFGSGGCFDNSKTACIGEVLKLKFNEQTGCFQETAIDPATNKELKEKCNLISRENEEEGVSPASASRRRREGEDDVPRGIICVCDGSGCNNKAGGGLGKSTSKGTASFVKALSAVWIGGLSIISLIGDVFMVVGQA